MDAEFWKRKIDIMENEQFNKLGISIRGGCEFIWWFKNEKTMRRNVDTIWNSEDVSL